MGEPLDLKAAKAIAAPELWARCRERAAAARSLNAWIEIYDETGSSRDGELAGIPVAVKGNIAMAGRELDCASQILAGYRSPFDATAIERLRAVGAVVLGRTNLDEFAMGSSTEHSRHGAARNPWDPERSAGGSSGGSAVAVASGCVPIALGSDTGGSVRQPASFCGVVGFKPSYGRISRYGLVAFASSLDQIGPIAHRVADAATVYQSLAGTDPRDMTSSNAAVEDCADALGRGLKGMRVGVPRDLLEEGVHDDVRNAFESSLDRFRAAGASVVDVELPLARHAIAIYYILASAEASSNLARYDGQIYGQRVDGKDLEESVRRTRSQLFGAEVQRRILLGTFVLSTGYQEAFYLKAQAARAQLARDHERAFSTCDVLATPTAPTTAFRLGEHLEDPLAMYLSDLFTVPANLTGCPAISLPCGLDAGGLPVGLHLTAARMCEPTLLRAAAGIESELDFDASRMPESWLA